MRPLDFICLGLGEGKNKCTGSSSGEGIEGGTECSAWTPSKTLHGKLFDCIFDMFTGLEDNRNAYKIVFYNLAHRATKK